MYGAKTFNAIDVDFVRPHDKWFATVDEENNCLANIC
jgi:hypothetical protein